jgi:hypothetical protein
MTDNHRVFENHKVVDKDGDGYHLKQEETRDGTITRRGLFSAAGNIAASKPVTFVSNSEQTFRDQYNVHNDMDDEQWDHHGDEVLDSEQRISQDHGVSFTSMPASGKLPYKTTSGAPNHEMLAHGMHTIEVIKYMQLIPVQVERIPPRPTATCTTRVTSATKTM